VLFGTLSAVWLALRITALTVLLAALAWAGYIGYQRAVRSGYFRVKQLEIAGLKRAEREQLAQRLGWTLGTSIFQISEERAVQAVTAHPWVAKASVRRRLPSALHVHVVEHEPAAVVLLGHLYLVNAEGEVFKRATLAEADGMPVISGVQRLAYLNGDEQPKRQIRSALGVLALYRAAQRPKVSEIHMGGNGEVTLFLRQGGTAIRFGSQLSLQRLRKLDAIWAALGPDVRRARAVYLDHETDANRVVVRMASYD
jgi:cell division protein FtsQ